MSAITLDLISTQLDSILTRLQSQSEQLQILTLALADLGILPAEIQAQSDQLQDLTLTLGRLDTAVAQLLAGSIPQPPPPAVTGAPMTVVSKVVNLYTYTETDAQGKPIMVIYPSDSAPKGARVQFHTGDTLLVKPYSIAASSTTYRFFECLRPLSIIRDGKSVVLNEPFFRTVNGQKVIGAALYIRVKDVRAS